MVKKSTDAKVTKTYTFKQVAFSLLPWSIIVLAIALALGFAAGWHTQHNLQQEIEAKTSAAVAQVKQAESKANR